MKKEGPGVAGRTGGGGGLADGERGGREPPRGRGRTHPDRKVPATGARARQRVRRIRIRGGGRHSGGRGLVA